MGLEQSIQGEQALNVTLEELPGFLRKEVEQLSRYVFLRLHALIDMGRQRNDLREEVNGKLEDFRCTPLLDDPSHPQLTEFGAMLVSSGSDAALLDAWGGCNGDIVSAWIVSGSSIQTLAKHFRRSTFAYDTNNTQYLLRYYDPKITPILHRVADKEWVDWFFKPMVAWWYPIATPTQESWSRIKGGGRTVALEKKSLVVGEELWDALVTDPFPYEVLNAVEQEFPSAFESKCYGVRLAKVESMLETGKESGLQTLDDLFVYVRALLEDPTRAGQPDWQAALQKAAADEAPLEAYFTQT